MKISTDDAYLAHRRAASRDRKAQLRAANRCICGPIEDNVSRRCRVVHGPVVSGGKCQRCLDVHKCGSQRVA